MTTQAKVALVTGAGTGIGKAAALTLRVEDHDDVAAAIEV